MPNWCENRMRVKGKQSEIEKFLQKAKGERENKESLVSLESLIPTPKELFEGQGWYPWRLGHWGTKWDLREVYITQNNGDGLLEVDYETAWSPICEAMLTLSEMFPMLEFYHMYIEQGVGFAGYETYKNGVMIKSRSKTELSTDGKAYRKIKRSIGWN